ncbi:MAG: AAA family ATPase [Pseudomonadota bacterium]|nr:AAA family ATPase [Pseudomonadota bacterium]
MEKISLKGFKGFKEQVEIELKKLTIIFGYNNSGKSTLLRSIPLISDSFKNHAPSSYMHSYLNYSSDSLRGAIHADVLSKGARDIEVSVDWTDIGIAFAVRQTAMEPEHLTKIDITKNGNKYQYRRSSFNNFIFEDENDEKVNIPSFFDISDSCLQTKIRETANNVHWISSIRTAPPRVFNIGLGTKVGINYKGDGIGETLWYVKKVSPEAFKVINDWLFETTNRRLKLDSSSTQSEGQGRTVVQLKTATDKEEEKPVDIIDSGEGIAQALPVVTLCTMAKFGLLQDSPIIAIEQPELHLHPKAIITLAEFIIDSVKDTENTKLVIETHSESFLLAIQSAIVKREILNQNLSCYWIEKDNNTSSASKITFDEEGYIEGNWPQTVFREIIAQSKELIQAREEKR